MKALSNNQIKKVITEYIEESLYDYAILINGEWGSGKTYFIKNELVESINQTNLSNNKKKNYKAVYISLYGIESVNAISTQIYINIANSIGNDRNILVKLKNIFSKTKPIINGVAGIVNQIKPIPTDLSLGKIIGQLSNLSDYVYIFDDLERCTISINDVLGYINNFVEQNSAKVIIVANEKEIGRINKSKNQELRYMIALNKDLKVLKETKDNVITYGSGSTYDEKLYLKDLKEKTDSIFSDDIIYKKIKEKLIGKTIYYKPELKTIVPSLISEIIDKKVIDVYDSIDIINELVISAIGGCRNLRTIQFALSCTNKILVLLLDKIRASEETEKEFDNARQALFEEIIFDIFRISIYVKDIKSKIKDFPSFEDRHYGYIASLDDTKYDYISRSKIVFKFNLNLIHDSVFDCEYIESVASQRFSDLLNEEKKTNDPLFIIKNKFWETDEKEVVNYYKEVMKNLEEKRYHYDFFVTIINVYYTLKDIGIDMNNIDIIMELMIKQIGDNQYNYNFNDSFPRTYDNKNLNLERKEKIALLREVNIRNGNNNNVSIVSEMLCSNDSWTSKLSEEYTDFNYYDAEAFLSLAEPIEYKELIINSSTKELSDFRRVFNTIYSNNFVSKINSEAEIKSLINLKDELEEAKKNVIDKVKLLNIKGFVKDISEKVEHLKRSYNIDETR